MNRRELTKWILPVVIAVALPAHAQTTIECNETDCWASGDPISVEASLIGRAEPELVLPGNVTEFFEKNSMEVE